MKSVFVGVDPRRGVSVGLSVCGNHFDELLATLTCQANGRFLRLIRAKRRARNFHKPALPEKPSLFRNNSRLKPAAAIVE